MLSNARQAHLCLTWKTKAPVSCLKFNSVCRGLILNTCCRRTRAHTHREGTDLVIFARLRQRTCEGYKYARFGVIMQTSGTYDASRKHLMTPCEGFFLSSSLDCRTCGTKTSATSQRGGTGASPLRLPQCEWHRSQEKVFAIVYYAAFFGRPAANARKCLASKGTCQV